MKRLILVLGLTAIFATISPGEPVKPWEPRAADLVRPLTSAVYAVEFKGGRRACAIASGDGSSFMALYVYDVHGNCIAWDDQAVYATKDDLAVDWYPRENAFYLIEARNCGVQSDPCKIILR